MKHISVRRLLVVFVLTAGLFCAGCSRSVINYQIAESIGTVGMFEDNQPVETPKMKAEREQREIEESEENVLQEELSEAEVLASQYRYEDAVSYLENIEKTEQNAERIDEKILEYQTAEQGMVAFTGDIPHLCFPVLIEDTLRAFDGDDYAAVYDSQMLTTSEFRKILESLYDNGYILIRIEDIAEITTDSRGVSLMEKKDLRLPANKKPIIVSQDDLNYSNVRNGDGIATRLAINDEGEVVAVYTDAEGHDLKGDYDVIPILNSFIEEHPDFSFKGARGIVSVSALAGIFGYDVAEGALMTSEENKETVAKIAQALKEEGWEIACAGYSHSYMNDMSYDQLVNDIRKWEEEAGTLVGSTSILFYPYGGEVSYPGEELKFLTENGYIYLCGLMSDGELLELGEGYMRQTRRFVDGYTLRYASDYFGPFFSAVSVMDSDR